MRTERLESRITSFSGLTAGELAAWNELCRIHGQYSSPFVSPAFVEAVASCRPHVYICVVFQEGCPAGFLPFQYRDTAHRLLGAAERVGEEMTDYFALVARPELRIDSSTLLRLAGLHYLYFTHLDETQLAFGLEAEKPETGLLIRLNGTANSPWQEIAKRNRKLARDTERCRRRLEASCGPLHFSFSETDWKAPLEHLVRFKRAQYARTESPDALIDPWKRKLLELLATSDSENCRGTLSTLYAGNTWVAFHFGLRSRTVFHHWFPVYNPELHQYSPGRLLQQEIMEAAAEAGIHTIDRGAGVTPSKKELSNASHLYYRGAWHRPSVQSAICRLKNSLRWRLAGDA